MGSVPKVSFKSLIVNQNTFLLKRSYKMVSFFEYPTKAHLSHKDFCDNSNPISEAWREGAVIWNGKEVECFCFYEAESTLEKTFKTRKIYVWLVPTSLSVSFSQGPRTLMLPILWHPTQVQHTLYILHVLESPTPPTVWCGKYGLCTTCIRIVWTAC